MAARLQFLPGTSSPPFSPARLREFEKQVKHRLPEVFVKLLSDANGGVPVEKFFTYANNEQVVERILPLCQDYKTDKFGIYDSEVVWTQIEDRLNDDLIPFAALFGGDFLCFDFAADSSQPKIVIWDHERSRQDSPSTIMVADSFTSFMKLLHR